MRFLAAIVAFLVVSAVGIAILSAPFLLIVPWSDGFWIVTTIAACIMIVPAQWVFWRILADTEFRR